MLRQAGSSLIAPTTSAWLRPVVVASVLGFHAAVLAGFGYQPPTLKPVDTIEIGIEREAQETEPVNAPVEIPEPAKPDPVEEEAPQTDVPKQEHIEQPAPLPPEPEPEPVKPRLVPPQIPVIKNKPAMIPGLKAEEVAAARASYGALVLAKIHAAKFYPPEARSSGATGIVGVQFSINGSGKVVSAHVMRSSGSDILDQAALAILRSLDLPAPPEGSFSANTNIKFTIAH